MKRKSGILITALLLALTAPLAAQEVVSTVAFCSQRDNPTGNPRINTNEVYLMDYLADGTFGPARRLTENADADFFPTLSPDGKGKIVFDSNRRRTAEEPLNVSDLFLMNHDGTEQTFLTRGGSPTWSPAGPNGEASKRIAFHASASGTGLPINAFPGSATSDSDIFVVNVDDLLALESIPQNITNDPLAIDDDPDWSPDGQKIIFTSHPLTDSGTNAPNAEIFSINPDGSGRTRLTFNSEEERAPAWSPDGELILFICRRADQTSFDICVMNADGTGQVRLTTTGGYLTPQWSPDGQLIVFHKAGENQLRTTRADGSGGEQRITNPPGINFLAMSWDVIQVGRPQNK